MFTRDDIVSLLEAVQAYDSRHVDDEMTDAWLLAATISKWTPQSAAIAVARHYAASTDRIMPGHVTALIRAHRSGTVSVRAIDEVRRDPKSGWVSEPSASESTRAEVMAQVRRALPAGRVKARKPWHQGPVERPVREIDPARIRTVARTAESAAASLAAKFSADSV